MEALEHVRNHIAQILKLLVHTEDYKMELLCLWSWCAFVLLRVLLTDHPNLLHLRCDLDSCKDPTTGPDEGPVHVSAVDGVSSLRSAL